MRVFNKGEMSGQGIFGRLCFLHPGPPRSLRSQPWDRMAQEADELTAAWLISSGMNETEALLHRQRNEPLIISQRVPMIMYPFFNSVGLFNLIRLGYLTGRSLWKESRANHPSLSTISLGASIRICYLLSGSPSLLILRRSVSSARRMILWQKRCSKRFMDYLPNKILSLKDRWTDQKGLVPFWRRKESQKSDRFVCKDLPACSSKGWERVKEDTG